LEEIAAHILAVILGGFNSTLVRLEETGFGEKRNRDARFNSTLVRLEGRLEAIPS